MDEKRRITAILRLLRKRYPHPQPGLNYHNAFQLLVATVLSAQCTDERINKITPDLFKRYPTPADLAQGEQHDVEVLIHSAGFFRNKAKHLIGAANLLINDFNGEIPQTMEELIRLPGVSRKTANVVQSHAFGIAEGIAVDTHVARIAVRLGLSSQKDPKKIEQDLLRKIPRKHWLDLNSLLVWFGRQVCPARKPHCSECELKRYCPYGQALLKG